MTTIEVMMAIPLAVLVAIIVVGMLAALPAAAVDIWHQGDESERALARAFASFIVLMWLVFMWLIGVCAYWAITDPSGFWDHR